MNKNTSLTATEYLNVIRKTTKIVTGIRYRADDLLDTDHHAGNEEAAGVVTDISQRLNMVEHALSEFSNTPTVEGMWWDYHILRPLELAIGRYMEDDERDKLTPFEIFNELASATEEVLSTLKRLKQEMKCFAWADGERRKRFAGMYRSDGKDIVNRDETPIANFHVVQE